MDADDEQMNGSGDGMRQRLRPAPSPAIRTIHPSPASGSADLHVNTATRAPPRHPPELAHPPSTSRSVWPRRFRRLLRHCQWFVELVWCVVCSLICIVCCFPCGGCCRCRDIDRRRSRHRHHRNNNRQKTWSQEKGGDVDEEDDHDTDGSDSTSSLSDASSDYTPVEHTGHESSETDNAECEHECKYCHRHLSSSVSHQQHHRRHFLCWRHRHHHHHHTHHGEGSRRHSCKYLLIFLSLISIYIILFVRITSGPQMADDGFDSSFGSSLGSGGSSHGNILSLEFGAPADLFPPIGIGLPIPGGLQSGLNALLGEQTRPGLRLASQGIQAHFPIVFVPGIVSTGLEVWQGLECARTYFRQRIWGSTNMIRSLLVDSRCWLKHLSLDPRTGLDPEGIKLRPSSGLEAADYLVGNFFIWAKIIHNLADVGYDPNSMFMAPYDWRLSMRHLEERDHYFSKLKSIIEVAKMSNHNRKVVMVAHSMGIQVINYFLRWVESASHGGGGPDWVSNHIESIVGIGAPWLGVPKVVSALLSGEMRDTAELAPMIDYWRQRMAFSQADGLAVMRTFRSLPSMFPKGGNVIWGDKMDGAPDEEAEEAIKMRDRRMEEKRNKRKTGGAGQTTNDDVASRNVNTTASTLNNRTGTVQNGTEASETTTSSVIHPPASYGHFLTFTEPIPWPFPNLTATITQSAADVHGHRSASTSSRPSHHGKRSKCNSAAAQTIDECMKDRINAHVDKDVQKGAASDGNSPMRGDASEERREQQTGFISSLTLEQTIVLFRQLAWPDASFNDNLYSQGFGALDPIGKETRLQRAHGTDTDTNTGSNIDAEQWQQQQESDREIAQQRSHRNAASDPATSSIAGVSREEGAQNKPYEAAADVDSMPSTSVEPPLELLDMTTDNDAAADIDSGIEPFPHPPPSSIPSTALDRYWTNPLESPLPRAPQMKIYCLYGVGRDTERGYIYARSPQKERESGEKQTVGNERSRQQEEKDERHQSHNGNDEECEDLDSEDEEDAQPTSSPSDSTNSSPQSKQAKKKKCARHSHGSKSAAASSSSSSTSSSSPSDASCPSSSSTSNGNCSPPPNTPPSTPSPPIPLFSLHTATEAADLRIRRGVRLVDGDGTVPIVSLGYMCVAGWKRKGRHSHQQHGSNVEEEEEEEGPLASRLNPGGVELITREYKESNTSTSLPLLLRAPTSTDHVDIMGNSEVIRDLIYIAAARRRPTTMTATTNKEKTNANGKNDPSPSTTATAPKSHLVTDPSDPSLVLTWSEVGERIHSRIRDISKRVDQRFLDRTGYRGEQGKEKVKTRGIMTPLLLTDSEPT